MGVDLNRNWGDHWNQGEQFSRGDMEGHIYTGSVTVCQLSTCMSSHRLVFDPDDGVNLMGHDVCHTGQFATTKSLESAGYPTE